MKKTFPFIIALGLFVLTSCNNGPGTTGKTDSIPPAKTGFENSPLKITAMPPSAEMPDAEVTLTSPDLSQTLKAGKTKFTFALKGFEMGKNTDGYDKTGLANSSMGQHLHVIPDNEPYMAHNTPEVELELTEGWHTLVVFPSRSWHESVKSPKAGFIKKFKVGTPKNTEPDITQPMIVYSRPKGKYSTPAETKKVMLDWYLFNCTLNEGGYFVRATINSQVFKYYKWEPLEMEGLAFGDNVVFLELKDKDDKNVPGEYNSTRRNFQVE